MCALGFLNIFYLSHPGICSESLVTDFRLLQESWKWQHVDGLTEVRVTLGHGCVVSCIRSHFPKNSWEPNWTPLQTAAQFLRGAFNITSGTLWGWGQSFYFCPCPKSCDFEVWGCNGGKRGRSVWVNHSYFMGALGKRRFSLGLIEMSIDLSHGKRKLGGVSILKFRSSPFEFCVRVQVGYWSFGWDKNPSPSLACANCALCSDAWSLANLFKPSVPKVSLHEGGKKQKTATLSAGLWFTVTWANLVLGAGCHSVTASHVAFKYLVQLSRFPNSTHVTSFSTSSH